MLLSLLLDIVLCSVHVCCPAVKLNGNRSVNGVLRGFDQFMNIVLEECVETTPNAPTKQQNVGTVVSDTAIPVFTRFHLYMCSLECSHFLAFCFALSTGHPR